MALRNSLTSFNITRSPTEYSSFKPPAALVTKRNDQGKKAEILDSDYQRECRLLVASLSELGMISPALNGLHNSYRMRI